MTRAACQSCPLAFVLSHGSGAGPDVARWRSGVSAHRSRQSLLPPRPHHATATVPHGPAESAGRGRAAGLHLQPRGPPRSVRQPAAARRRLRAVAAAKRAPAWPGSGLRRVSLRGTITSQGAFVAILQGADSKTYIVRAGDRLVDGTIRTITADAMVILQQVNDPLSLEKAARSAKGAPTDGRGEVVERFGRTMPATYRFSMLLGLCLAMALGVVNPLRAAAPGMTPRC